MGSPYVGEIRLFAGNFAPVNWALCNGQILSIASYSTLFNLIGTTYGGNGTTTFALPDLQGRVPIHQGQGSGLSNRVLGQSGGSENLATVPAHTHTLNGIIAPATSGDPGLNLVAASRVSIYAPPSSLVAMSSQAIAANVGSGQQVEKMPPYVGINYIISLFGIFPTQN